MSFPTGQCPAEIVAMRDMLMECNSWTTNNGGHGQIHYPDVLVSTSTVFPCIILTREDHDIIPYAAGSGGLPQGRMTLCLWAQEELPMIEAMANGIVDDLGRATTGLAIRSATAGVAQDIANGQVAAVDDGTVPAFRQCLITVTYGLGV